ncbi:hypothetical protein [Kribbella sp. NPDC050459]|uniref:hypothetical protein n=1 Tax=Kribbella sp. NPDC050459 TaxID=3155785 RepID=UPI0034080785
MDLAALQTRAVAINQLYDRHNEAAGRTPWTTTDLALGFVGDVGDLAKLIMATEGRRHIDNAEAHLGHELADCLWSVLVLADRYNIDLPTEFTQMTNTLETELTALDEARDHRILTAPATATAIREASDTDWAWRMLLQGRDHLRLLLDRHDGSEAAWEAAPDTTDHAGFDTLLAVLTAQEFKAAGGDPPAWTEAEALSDPWIPEHPFLERDEIIEQTPDYLAQVNIFVPARDLVTA